MGSSIDDLLRYPFSGLKYDEKMDFVLRGKPRPRLNCSLNADEYKMPFDESIYDDISWLTGSGKFQRLFCWPCLLFDSDTTGNWNTCGIPFSSLLLEQTCKHKDTRRHIQASFDLQLFIMHMKKSADIPVSEPEPIIQTLAEVVARNRENLKYLIDLVCNCAAIKQPPDIGSYSGPLEITDCVKMLQFASNYDTCKVNEIDSVIKLIKNSPQFLNDVVDSISEVIKNSLKEYNTNNYSSIKKEIQMSTYVSLILSEHSDSADKSLISTVLRYLRNGEVCERFVGFVNSKHCRSSNAVYQHFSNVISEFNISERFIAYSLDGGILEMQFLSNFVNIMKKHHPLVFFVPWHAHELNKVFQQCLLSIREFNFFFKTLTAIENFFRKHSKRWEEFEHFVGIAHFVEKSAPSSSNIWFTRSETIQVVHLYRKYFIEFFDSILQKSNGWDAETIAQVSEFQQYLKKFQTMFLIRVFMKILDLTSDFSLHLKNNKLENFSSCKSLFKLNESLKTNQGPCLAKNFVNNAFQVIGKEMSNYSRFNIISDIAQSTYVQQFQLSIGHIMYTIHSRFDGLKALDFCSLLRYEVYTNTLTTRYFMEKIPKMLGQYFDPEKIFTELQVLQAHASAVDKKTIDALFDFFVEANLKNTLPCLYQLAELAMTLPIKRRPNNYNASKLNTIANYCYTPQESAISGDVSILCVELDYVRELKKSEVFYDDVITKFFKVNQTIALF